MKSKMIIRGLSLLLTVLMLIPVLAGCAGDDNARGNSVLLYDTFAEYEANSTHLHPETDNDLRYALYDNFAQVIECISPNPDIVIPDLYKGVPVISIREAAFANNHTMKHLTIGSYVLQIQPDAFINCDALTYVKMSSSVNEIGSGAFSGCLKLTSIVIPPRVNEILSGTFSNCASLRKVVVESSDMAVDTTSEEGGRLIQASTFDNCERLSIMWIPEDITTVEDSILGGSTPKPLICGGDATASSWFATLQCLDYELVARDDFDAHARRYNQTNDIAKTQIGQRIRVGQLTVTLEDVSSFKKLGSVAAGENQLLVAVKFTIYNPTQITQYFNGLAVDCKSIAPGRDGYIEAFRKYPMLVDSSVLGAPYPVGNVPANNQTHGVIVLRVSDRFESIEILFAGAEEPFVI